MRYFIFNIVVVCKASNYLAEYRNERWGADPEEKCSKTFSSELCGSFCGILRDQLCSAYFLWSV